LEMAPIGRSYMTFITIIIIVNDKGPKPLTCQNKNNSKIQS